MRVRYKGLVPGLFLEDSTQLTMQLEHIDSDSLIHWIHQCTTNFSPLTWQIRMKMIIGIGKGSAYFHDDTEPTFAHRNLKSINILLDQKWNPNISDCGNDRFLGPERNHDTTYQTGMSGEQKPESKDDGRRDEYIIKEFMVVDMVVAPSPSPSLL